MTDQLTIFKAALSHLQERTIASLTENREPVRVLNDLWPETLAYCLEREFWNFTYRAVRIDASTTVVPSFGYSYAFKIPPDWVRTRKLSAVPQFDPPLLDVKEETGYWYTNITPIYLQYNSNDAQYGNNLGKWPPSFADYVELRLAVRACGRLAGKSELLQGPDGLIKREYKAYKVAISNCAMNESIGFAPLCSWAAARRQPGPNIDYPTGTGLVP